jgi:hypothetical protein
LFGLDKTTFVKLINLLLFQGLWFLTVLGAAGGNGWIGLVGISIFLMTHHLTSSTAQVDFKIAGIAVLIGLAAETLFVNTGLLIYNASIPSQNFAPVWILVLWAGFALTINGCISWLHGKYLLAGLLGAIGGPLSYLGGLELGAATTESPLILVLGAIAVVYAIVTPCLFYLASRLTGQQ